MSIGLAMDVARSAPQGAHYHTDDIYLAPLTGTEKGSMGLMVLRVRPTPTRFSTNILCIPLDSTTLNSIPSVWHPWGCQMASIRVLKKAMTKRIPFETAPATTTTFMSTLLFPDREIHKLEFESCHAPNQTRNYGLALLTLLVNSTYQCVVRRLVNDYTTSLLFTQRRSMFMPRLLLFLFCLFFFHNYYVLELCVLCQMVQSPWYRVF